MLALIRDVNTAAALEVLPMVQSSTRMCAASIRSAAQRGSLRGVRVLLQHAVDEGLAAGPEGAAVWRAAIVAFGQLKQPGEARRAFSGMRQVGAWGPEDTPTVNLLLNALAGDVQLQFIR